MARLDKIRNERRIGSVGVAGIEGRIRKNRLRWYR